MAKPSPKTYTSYPISVPNLSRWTVTQVQAALAQHEQGNFHTSAFLWEALDRNPRVNAAVNRRVLTVLGLPSRLDAGTGDGRRNDSAVTRLTPYWPKIASRKVSSKQLRNGIGLGLSFGRRVWSVVNGDWVPRVQPWHSSFFYWDSVRRCYMAQTQQGLAEVRQGENDWVIFSYDEWDDEPWQRGVVRCVGLPDAIRSYAVRDWARYSEVHGLPIRMLEVPMDEGDTEEKQQVISQVENPGSEMTVVAPKGKDDASSYKLSLVEPTDRSWEGFERLKKGMDSDIALAVSGIELLREGLVYEPKDNSEGVRQDYTEADAAALSEFQHTQLSQPWALFNLGPGAVDSAPKPCIDSSRPVDKSANATTLKMLGDGLTAINAELRKIGQEVDPVYIQKFEIPLRKSDVQPDPTPAQNGAPARGQGAANSY